MMHNFELQRSTHLSVKSVIARSMSISAYPVKNGLMPPPLSQTNARSMDTRFLPRVTVLQKGQRGFGFVVQSKRATGGIFVPTDEIPSLHYLGHVEENNVAYRANLQPYDFILEVNGINVATFSHQEVVEAIRDSGDMLSLKVVTLPSNENQQSDCQDDNMESFKNGMSGEDIQYSTLGRKNNGKNGFGSQLMSLVSPRSMKNGSYSNRNSGFGNEISSQGINGLATIRRPNVPNHKSHSETSVGADYNQRQYLATIPPKPTTNGNDYSYSTMDSYSNEGTLRRSSAPKTNGFPPSHTNALSVPPPAPPPPPPPPPPLSFGNRSGLSQSTNGYVTTTAICADRNTIKKSSLRRPSITTVQIKSLEPQESTPSPPPLFRNSNGSVNPLLASVLAKLDASEDSDALGFNPKPPKQEFISAPLACSFEENLKAAIARRRLQMNQSRESSESEDDLNGTRSATGRLNQHQMSSSPPQLFNQPPKPLSTNVSTGSRRPPLLDRYEFSGGGATFRMTQSGVPQPPTSPPPPPPPPPPQSSKWTA
ncbi:hypothetical protein ACTXT7_002901 [Hymenolepis weldensis]